MENPEIGELSSRYGDVAAQACAEVYKALGVPGNLSYHSNVPSSEGGHCSLRSEWAPILKSNIEWFLKKTGTPAGVINPASKESKPLSDWRDWTTPTLN